MTKETLKKRIELRVENELYCRIKKAAEKQYKHVTHYIKDILVDATSISSDSSSLDNNVVYNGGLNNGQKKRIDLRVDEEEYLIIKREADRQYKQVGTYIKDMSLNGFSFSYDYVFLKEYIDCIRKYNNDINRLILTVVSTGEYFPSDLDIVQTQMKKIIDNQNTILKQIRKDKISIINAIKKSSIVSET